MNSRKTHFWFWLVFAVMGRAAALQMIRAGNQLRYQHYPPLGLLVQETPLWVLLVFGFQILAVSIGLIKYRRKIIKWIAEQL